MLHPVPSQVSWVNKITIPGKMQIETNLKTTAMLIVDEF